MYRIGIWIFALSTSLALQSVNGGRKYKIETVLGNRYLATIKALQNTTEKRGADGLLGRISDVKFVSGSDYYGNPYEHRESIPEVEAFLGSEAQLMCKSSLSFSNCQFVSPSGEIVRISKQKSYENKRMLCLCSVLKYDDTKVCGIRITEVKTEDKGEWTCQMEYTTKTGRKIKAGSKTMLKVTEPPTTRAPTEVVAPVKGDFNKYTSPEEMVIKRNNLITVLPHLGREFDIEFDIFISDFGYGDWHSVLHFTGDGNSDKFGDRVPGIWTLEPHGLSIYNQAPGLGYTNKTGLPKHVWNTMKIKQTLIKNKYLYEVFINNVLVFTKENKKACLIKAVKVYAGDPWYQPFKGKIKNLAVKTSDAMDGSCVVDFRVRNDQDSQGYILKEEMVIKQNNLITVLPHLGKEFYISFDVFINKFGNAAYASVIHFTGDGNAWLFGDRNPAVWINVHKQLCVFNNVHNLQYAGKAGMEILKWINVEISQKLINNKYMHEIKINKESVFNQENKRATIFKAVKVFGGDPWYPPVDGKIRNVLVDTEIKAEKVDVKDPYNV